MSTAPDSEPLPVPEFEEPPAPPAPAKLEDSLTALKDDADTLLSDLMKQYFIYALVAILTIFLSGLLYEFVTGRDIGIQSTFWSFMKFVNDLLMSWAF